MVPTLTSPISSRSAELRGLLWFFALALLLAAGTFYWVRRPDNRWLAWGFSIIAALAIAASLAGIFLSPLAKAAG